MSKTVHYRGVATKIEQPHDKTLLDVVKGILKERNYVVADYYNNALECLTQEFCDEYFYHPKTQTLYSITKTDHDLDEEIIKAEPKDDGTIEYELRYYNGGAGFEECMEEAFDKLDT
jgi:hypothetical protein